MTRQHKFARGLTVCVLVILLCIFGTLWGPTLGMVGIAIAGLFFYSGALLLGSAIWPSDRN